MKQIVQNEELIETIMLDLKIPAVAQTCALESLLETSETKFMPKEADLIKLTLSSCKYLKRLIDTFLAIQKLNNTTFSLNHKKFYPNEILQKILCELEIIIKFNNLKLKINSADNLVINADKIYMEHAFQNILYNCINSAYKSSEMEINLLNNKNHMTFEVKYCADYIEPEIIKEIFNKQKNISAPFGRPRVGLGLYLSKEIIKAHFGGMIAKSNSNNTNIFGFYIPI